MPRPTALHHQSCILQVLREALDEAKISPKEIDAIAFTKGMHEKKSFYFPSSYLDLFVHFLTIRLTFSIRGLLRCISQTTLVISRQFSSKSMYGIIILIF